MNILQSIEQTVIGYLKARVKIGSWTKEQLLELFQVQKKYLTTLIFGLSAFDKSSMAKTMEKYLATQMPPKDKDAVGKYIPAMRTGFTGTAAALDRGMPFGAALATAKVLLKIVEDIEKHIDTLFPTDRVQVFDTRLSGVAVLGILRQTDIVMKVTAILFGHVVDTVTQKKTGIPGYQESYLKNNFSRYLDIVNNVCNKEQNYNFLKDVESLQKSNSDMVLYANQQSFLNFLNPAKISGAMMQNLKYGLIGFGIFTWIMGLWDDWVHVQYLRDKDFKAWMESRVALLRMELASMDPNSEEYRKLANIIQAYEAKIIEHDRKLAEYEKE